ncbi:MAG: hypothetical protein B6241_05300 [Spirochaetaceae bacterium 4572_59]|nr:MAG: hypothetical protein B6241_05300 [Spirochaetaceae bacterium 4572_59]
MQIYFLVVITNILSGLVLSGSFLEEKIEGFSSCNALMQRGKFKLVLGIITVLTALFTLLLKITPEDVIVLGDLLPALTGGIMGSYLIMSFFYGSLEETRSWMKSFVDVMEDRGHIIGIAAVLVGIIHFLVPSAIIL